MANRDRQRLVRLLPYLGRDRKRLLLTLVLLIPVAGAAAVQPLLVGQAISALRQEPVLAWLAPMSLSGQLRTLVLLLLVAVLIRSVCRAAELQRPGRWSTSDRPDSQRSIRPCDGSLPSLP